MITYNEFLVLVSLNYWPDAGFPEADLPYFTMQATEGDPRGDISAEDAFATFDAIVNKGWAEVRDDGGVPTAYVTPEGIKVFQEHKDEFAEQVKMARVTRRIVRNLAEHLGSEEAANAWLDVQNPSMAKTPREHIQEGQHTIVLSHLKDQWGPNPSYS